MNHKSTKKGGRNLKDCLFSVIADGILESTHPVGCLNISGPHPEKTRERFKKYIPQKLHLRGGRPFNVQKCQRNIKLSLVVE